MAVRSDKEYLFREAPIPRAVLELAVPTVIGQIILVIYNMSDTFFISLTGSDAMITAVTVCMPAFTAISAVSNLFGVGGAAAISRFRGRGRLKAAKGAVSFAVYGCLITAAVYSLAVLLLTRTVIQLLGGGAAGVSPYVRQYLLTTVVMGCIPTAMATMLSHLVRSEGRSVHAALGVALGGVLNIGLDPLFMFVLMPKGDEVRGAAMATALSNLAAFLYFAAVVHKGRGRSILSFKLRRSAKDRAVVAEVLKSGLPACIMTLFESVSYAVLDKLLSSYGIMVQAGIGVAKKVNMLAHCMVRGISQGILPLIAYNFASKDHRRMRAATTFGLAISVGVSCLCTAACLLFPDELIAIFLQDGESASYGVAFLKILCLGCPLSAGAYMVISFFQAVGSGGRSFFLAIMRKGVLDITLMFILGTAFPVHGTVWATPAADGICFLAAIVLLVLFLRKHRVEEKPVLDEEEVEVPDIAPEPVHFPGGI